jgi:methionine-rich copper-binding protein CopC
MRAAILIILLLALSDVPAYGHAGLVSASPSADGVLERSPTAVRLRFSEPVTGGPDALVVVDATGSRISGTARLDGDRLSTPLGPLGTGRYAYAYDIVSVDGHEVIAASAFAVGVATPRAVPVRIALGTRRLALSGARVGVRSIRLWGGLREGTVRWTSPLLGAPFVWTFHDGVARGMLPFSGTYAVEVRARVGVFGERIASGTVEIAP